MTAQLISVCSLDAKLEVNGEVEAIAEFRLLRQTHITLQKACMESGVVSGLCDILWVFSFTGPAASSLHSYQVKEKGVTLTAHFRIHGFNGQIVACWRGVFLFEIS